MKATELLKKQHQEAKALIDRLERCEPDQRSPILAELSTATRAHIQCEEEIFYPKLESNTETRDMVEESYEDHEELKAALADLERSSVHDQGFLDQVQVLEDLHVGHVMDEEGSLLPKVEALWTPEMERRIGDELERRYHELAAGEHEMRL